MPIRIQEGVAKNKETIATIFVPKISHNLPQTALAIMEGTM
jgi:hypothetical protein